MKSKLRTFINILGWCAFALVLISAGILLSAYVAYQRYERRAGGFDLAQLKALSERSAVYSGDGQLHSYLHGENRVVVPLHRVSPHFLRALIAREDSRFREHDGVDFHGIARAAYTNVRRGGVAQGASTITQQLARNTFDLSGRTLDRKALEAVLARRIERSFSKDEILELYVNRIYFGSGFHGIETAARGYFDKPAGELTAGEGALLAGIIRSPNRFSPMRDLSGALAERDVVIDRMQELQAITAEESAAAKALPIEVATRKSMRFEEDYVMDAAGRELEWLLAPEVIQFGGLRIFTTIDPALQERAQSAADRRLAEIEAGKKYAHPKKADHVRTLDADGIEVPTRYLQAAVVAIDNRTGAIRAIVGGRDYTHSKYPRALLAKRQIGSTFKPFVYATAFQRGLLPGTLIDDSKILPGEFQTISAKWSPENSDGDYVGLQPAAWGLLKSRNTMAVRIGEYAGNSAVRTVARAAGIGDTMPDLPVAYLGAFETNLRELTAAYTVFPNHGIRRTPHLVARVEDTAGRILYQAPQTETRVLSPESAWMTSWILQHVTKTGTASKAASLGWKKPGAGKTGTTNDFFDAWFVGYTTSLTCGVWVGFDEPQTIMEKGYGSALALPIWVDVMQGAPEKMYPAIAFVPPVRLLPVRLCSASAGRTTAQCEQLQLGYEAQLSAAQIPAQTCTKHPDLPPPSLYVGTPTLSTPPSASGTSIDSSVPPSSPALVVHGPTGVTRIDPAYERTANGPPVVLRSNGTGETRRVIPDAPLADPAEPVRVRRAIPIERSRRPVAEEESEDVPVYRGEVIRRSNRSAIGRGFSNDSQW